MKYIRVDNTSFIYKFNDDADYMQYDNIKGHIIKVTDTIKELCDLWICVDLKDNKQDVSFDFNDFEIELESKEYIIYGAILNIEDIDNPILKIVAKTNEKGEPELIWN